MSLHPYCNHCKQRGHWPGDCPKRAQLPKKDAAQLPNADTVTHVTHKPEVTHAPFDPVTHAVTHGMTNAEKQAKWRRDHPDQHAANQRKYRERKKQNG